MYHDNKKNNQNKDSTIVPSTSFCTHLTKFEHRLKASRQCIFPSVKFITALSTCSMPSLISVSFRDPSLYNFKVNYLKTLHHLNKKLNDESSSMYHGLPS